VLYNIPITLLNIDTKIIAYTLAQRIKSLLHKIINSNQNGYIKNRYFEHSSMVNSPSAALLSSLDSLFSIFVALIYSSILIGSGFFVS
jgi:hypothetical protein